MKIKLPRKKEKEESQPQKGFEEFAIDPSILDELDSLDDEQETINADENETIEEAVETIEEVEVVEKKENTIVDASSVEFINIVKNNINSCAQEIKEISETMDQIEAQKNSEAFWKKGENIRTISKNVNKMSEVQQKTLDLLVMFLGASGKMADDYDTILQTIDELGELNGGEAEVLDYLLKVKRMIKEIKSNDERLKQIIFDINNHSKEIEALKDNYNKKISTFEKDFKIYNSKLKRITKKYNILTSFLLLSYILIALIGVIIYLKLFK